METRIIDLNDFELSGGGKLEEYGRSCHENPSKVAPVDRAVIVSPN